MNKLVFVRYGEHENGDLNESGKEAMILIGEKLKSVVEGRNTSIICAEILRAVESAEIIAKNLNLSLVRHFTELYASEDVPVNLEKALEVINSEGKECDLLIAVVSREYIETLPNYILQSLGVQNTVETHLKRGEILILDYNKKDIIYLR